MIRIGHKFTGDHWGRRARSAMSDEKTEFERVGEDSQQSFLAEFFEFLKYNKKWWLLPILLVMLLLVGVILASGSAAAPFIYALF
jgi:hypothetical protein